MPKLVAENLSNQEFVDRKASPSADPPVVYKVQYQTWKIHPPTPP
jgi:hypothetical protein